MPVMYSSAYTQSLIKIQIWYFNINILKSTTVAIIYFMIAAKMIDRGQFEELGYRQTPSPQLKTQTKPYMIRPLLMILGE